MDQPNTVNPNPLGSSSTDVGTLPSVHLPPTSPSTAVATQNEAAPKLRKEVQKKVLMAKQTFWTDIPDWQDRDDCPLGRLPLEVLDLCFGLRDDLELSDYVALAGTCRYFRRHLDDEVFHGLCYAKGVKGVFSDPEPVVMRHSLSPFSRIVENWFKPQPKIPANQYLSELTAAWQAPFLSYRERKTGTKLSINSLAPYQTPSGDKSTWSRKVYIKYKADKKAYVLSLERAGRDAEKELADAAGVHNKNSPKMVRMGNVRRTILATISGRLDGRPAVGKDEYGMPVPEEPSEMGKTDDFTSQNQNQGKRSTALHSASIAIPPSNPTPTRRRVVHATRGRRHIRDPDSSSEDEKPPMKRGRITRSQVPPRSTTWKGPPETDTEPELEPITRYDYTGERVVYDGWKSVWRYTAVESTLVRINKTSAIQDYKVSDAHLITLKHVLVYNPNSSKIPQQLYFKAAVRAMALRVHNGVQGLADRLQSAKVRSERVRKANEEKIKAAKQNGTYVPKRKETLPPWLYAMEQVYGAYALGCACGICWDTVFDY